MNSLVIKIEKIGCLFQSDDASVMCPPYVGKNYKQGGLIIMPINPGGGNETSEIRDIGDNIIFPVLHEYKKINKNVEEYYWNVFVPTFRKAKPTWKIYKDMLPVLTASNCSLDNISYFNFVPYRGRNNRYPNRVFEMNEIIPKTIDKFVKPILNLLQTSLIINFGKQVDTYIDRYWNKFSYQTVSWNRARALNTNVINDREESIRLIKEWTQN